MHRLQTKTKWWALCLLAFLSVATPLIPYLRGDASAAIAGGGSGSGTVTSSFDATKDQHIDRSTILYKGVYYYDSKIDDNYTYKSPTPTAGCDDRIAELRNKNKTATLHTYVKDAATGSCTETKKDITLEHPERSQMPFDFTDDKTIVTSDGKNTYTLSQDPAHAGEFLEVGGDQCKDIIKVTSGPGDSGASLSVLASTSQDGAQNTSYKDWANEMAFSYDNYNSANGCVTLGPNPYQASTVYLYNAAAAKNAPAAVATGSNSGTTEVATCETSAGVLSWIVCPVIYLIAHGVDGIYNYMIEPFLKTSPLPLGTDSSNFKVWSSFRIIGDIFLVIALLIIVFGQSLGGGLIDAYSAKKILPRLLAAAILINLSYYIVALAIDVTNVIGDGIQSLLLTPFKIAKSGIRVGNGSVGIGLAGAIGTAFAAASSTGTAVIGSVTAAAVESAGLATGGLISGLLPAFMLFVVLPAILIVLGILAVVILRQGLIIFLVLSSPIAFALYCLPNTEKYYRKWVDLLLKTLLVYPIISVLFALSNILAITVTNTNASGVTGTLNPLIAIIALFVPLFLIPFAFKLAGGVLGRLHEVASGLGKRGVEAVKGNPNNPLSFRNQAKNKALNSLNATGAQAYRNLNKNGRPNKFGARLLGSTIEREALQNASAAQRLSAVKEKGDDRILNAAASWLDHDDRDAGGNPIRKTLDGKRVNAMDYEAAKLNYPTLADRQFVSDYRAGKINSTEEAEAFTSNYAKMCQQNGMTLEQTQGAFTALSFAKQNERGEWKHGKWSENANGSFQYTPPGADDMYEGTESGEASKTAANTFVQEQYHKKGSFDAARAFSSQFVAINDVKRQHVGEINRVEQAKANGTATQADQVSSDAAREQLRKVLEIQDAWGKNGGGRDPETGDPIVGISGANSATIAAYNQLIASDAGDTTIKSVKSEISQGKTWEALNNGREIVPPQSTQSARPPQQRPPGEDAGYM